MDISVQAVPLFSSLLLLAGNCSLSVKGKTVGKSRVGQVGFSWL